MPTASLEQRLAKQKQANLTRRRRVVVATSQSTLVSCQNKICISFAGNDYLGLANHPRVVTALQQGAARYGVGSGASQLITGYTSAHQALEEAFAAFVGRERALLFSTGYLANLGVLSALAGRHDLLLLDRLCHASLIDAARLTGATFKRYAHNDTQQLAAQLAGARQATKFIVTDAVFSMEGDVAPLPKLAQVAREHHAWLVVDDAHGFGVLGQHGKGALEQFGLAPAEVPVLICPFGKAMGCFGAMVAGSRTLIETLLQFARTACYTTALPPALACAAHEALRLLSHETWRREKLRALVHFFKQNAQERGLPFVPSDTPIQALLVGEAQQLLALQERLFAQGFLVAAIRPPTVPLHGERLRISLSALHNEQQITQLLDTLAEAYLAIKG